MVRHPVKNRDEEEKEFQELQKELSIIGEMRTQLDKRLEKICTEGGFDLTDISNYLDNPDNFTKEQQQRIQRYRGEVQDFLWSILGEDAKAKMTKERLAKTTEKRKKKGVSSRRRGWIKMD